MLPLEHSAILSTSIKLPFVIKIFVLSIFSDCLRQVLLCDLTGSSEPSLVVYAINTKCPCAGLKTLNGELLVGIKQACMTYKDF